MVYSLGSRPKNMYQGRHQFSKMIYKSDVKNGTDDGDV